MERESKEKYTGKTIMQLQHVSSYLTKPEYDLKDILGRNEQIETGFKLINDEISKIQNKLRDYIDDEI